jgi:ribonuclease E
MAAEPLTTAPEPEPVAAAAEPEKVLEPAVAEVDPHEIAAPPEKPKRGWWRR